MNADDLHGFSEDQSYACKYRNREKAFHVVNAQFMYYFYSSNLVWLEKRVLKGVQLGRSQKGSWVQYPMLKDFDPGL